MYLTCMEDPKSSERSSNLSSWPADGIVQFTLPTLHSPRGINHPVRCDWCRMVKNGMKKGVESSGMGPDASAQVRNGLNKFTPGWKCSGMWEWVLADLCGNGPVKAHVSCQDSSVDGEHVCDSVRHNFSLFSTWSNEAWSSSVVPVSTGWTSVLISFFSSRPHNGFIWSLISFFFLASDRKCGLAHMSLVGSVSGVFRSIWCHSWMKLICIICCLKQRATDGYLFSDATCSNRTASPLWCLHRPE